MSYTPKHAKPVSSKEGAPGSRRNPFGLLEAYAARHAASAGKPRQAAREQDRQPQMAA